MIERPDRAGFSAQPRGKVLRASVTPLASIFGSGFLIIVPILERTLAALGVVGMAGRLRSCVARRWGDTSQRRRCRAG